MVFAMVIVEPVWYSLGVEECFEILFDYDKECIKKGSELSQQATEATCLVHDKCQTIKLRNWLLVLCRASYRHSRWTPSGPLREYIGST